jgi:hypothetical protein
MLGVLFVGPWLLVPLGLVGLLVAAPAARSGYVLWASFVPAYDALAVAVFYVTTGIRRRCSSRCASRVARHSTRS